MSKVLEEFMGFSKPFNKSWDAIMQVVEKLESLDLKDKMYTWECYGEIRYNFMNIEVDISHNKCWISVSLELDPPIWLNEKWVEKQNSLDEEFISSKL